MAKGTGVKVEKPRYRYDAGGWRNIATGLGVNGVDKTENNKFLNGIDLDQNTLEAIYKKGGIGKRIIDLIAGELVREWFNVKGDTDGLILNYLQVLKTKRKFTSALKWARLYGGSVIVMGIDDGGDFDDPVNVNMIKSIRFLHVFDKWRAIPQFDLISTIDSITYNQPTFYQISPIRGVQGSFLVHESRILRFEGEEATPIQEAMNLGWGNSVIESIYNEFMNWASSQKYASNIIADFVLTILNIDNLTGLLSDKEGANTLIQRAQVMNLTRSIANTQILGTEEKLTKLTSNVAGLPEMLDQFAKALSAVTGIPLTLLMGQSPGGLNATGDSDIRNWYDSIKVEQNEVLRPQLDKLIKYLLAARDSPFGKRGLPQFEIDFNPLWQLSDTEKAAIYFQMAQGDNLYINNGTVHPDEIAVSRFGGDKYSLNTKLLFSREPGDGLPPMPEDDDEPAQPDNEADNQLNEQAKPEDKAITAQAKQ